jgi:multidrug efflux pump subunit AcrB
MNISEFSVKNWQFMLVMFIGVVALGLNSLFNMPRGEDPEFFAPTFAIVYVYPGADALDIEELIVDKVEKRLNGLENVNTLKTSIDDGLAIVIIEYDYSESPDEKYQELVREVDALKSDLPQDIFRVEIKRFSPTDVNIIQLALVSETASKREMGKHADRLKDELVKVKSLKSVQNWGFPASTVRVSLQIEKMALEQIPLNQVLQALQASNLNIPGGSIQAGTRKFNVKTSGDFKSLDEIRNTIVATTGFGTPSQKIIYLKDVASVAYNYEDETHITRLNGHRSVVVTAAQKEGQNIEKVGELIYPILEKYEKTLPAHIQLVKNFDQAESVSKRLGRFKTDFAIAILLVAITLLPLGFRAALVVMISIPLSLAMGLSAIDFLGFSINQLSIVGLIVALGILVDDSIVVVENIERWMRDGYSKRESAILATKQITLAVIGCTVTLILAFLPLNFLPEASGDFIRSLPMAVTMTILSSMVVSLTIVPFLSSRLLKASGHSDGNFFLRALKKVISGSYSKLLHWGLHNPLKTLGIALAIFGCSLLIPSMIGFALFPASEKPMFLITMETPYGTTLSETDRIATVVEAELKKIPELKYSTTNIGMGNPRIYYNLIQHSEASNYAEFFVQLQDMKPADKVAIIEVLRSKLAYIPNAKVEVKDFEQGPSTEAPIAIRIFGEDFEDLRTWAAKVEADLSTTAGTIYVNNPLASRKTDLRVKVNKEKAGLLGVSVVEVDKTIRMAVAGLQAGTYTDEKGDEYQIQVTVPKGKAADLTVLENIYINTLTGTSIPLKQVADIQFESAVNQIRRYDQNRYVTVSAYVKQGFLVDDVYREVIDKLDQHQFPEGFYYKAAGELEAREKSFGGLGTIILITAFGFLGVLILEFGTFKSSLIVLSVIPLGVIGALTALYLVGYPLSFVAIVGFIALIGIEVKNSILLVDFTNQLRREGMPLIEAIQQAGEIRFVPIVLTSLTAIGGLIPLAIEGNPLYSPLAWVLIGGLISSTILSRIVTPVLYKLLPPEVESPVL